VGAPTRVVAACARKVAGNRNAHGRRSMSSVSEVAEVVSFLDDPRADVREMAAGGVAGFTASAESTAMLCQVDGVLAKLVKLLERARLPECATCAASAAAALVNLSQQPAERVKLLEVANAVGSAAECIDLDDPPELAEYASMLLSNLTTLKAGVGALLAVDADERSDDAKTVRRLHALLARLGATTGERCAHIALLLTNATQEPAARASLLQAIRPSDGQPGTTAWLQGLSSPDPTRRLGVQRLARNLCFAAAPTESESSRATLLAPAVLNPLIVALVARLAVRHPRYRANELEGFAPELHAALSAEPGLLNQPGDEGTPQEGDADGKLVIGLPNQAGDDGGDMDERTPQESDADGRLVMTEALLLLTAAPAASAAMRRLGIYPVLRDAHLAEEDTDGIPTRVREVNEQLVEVFYMSAEALAEDKVALPDGRLAAEDSSAEIEEVVE